MVLKEIEMDLPYVQNEERIKSYMKNKIDYEEAKKIDYEVNWKQKRREFQLMTRCMTSMIERLIPPISTKDCWKIMVECTTDPTRTKCRNLMGVYVVPVIIEHDDFFGMDDLGKKKFTVNKVVEAIEVVASTTDADMDDIWQTCSKIEQAGYVNEWMWKKPVKSKNGFVQLKIKQEVNETVLSMVFFSLKMDMINEVPIAVSGQDERTYSQLLGGLRWKNERTAELVTKQGQSITVDCNMETRSE